MPGRLFLGTSGFAYPEWKGGFYPSDIRPDGMLRFYSTRFSSVEINYTFQRKLSPKTIARWIEDTPDGFVFSPKASWRITHIYRLSPEAPEPVKEFFDTVEPLGDRLGPILFQTHPTTKADVPRFRDFLALLPPGFRAAFEFRHESWANDAVRDVLAERDLAWCVADTDEADASFERTARGYAYVRLRKTFYEDEALARWAKDIRAALDEGTDVYCYLMHEDECRGPAYGMRLKELLSAGE